MEYEFEAKLWEWKGKSAWYFITVPKKYYEDIKEVASAYKKGFGSVRVEVTVGGSVWKTSVFPDTKLKSFVMPVKKSIRKAENLNVGGTFKITINMFEI